MPGDQQKQRLKHPPLGYKQYKALDPAAEDYQIRTRKNQWHRLCVTWQLCNEYRMPPYMMIEHADNNNLHDSWQHKWWNGNIIMALTVQQR